jgi:hypothetical protein
MKMPRPSGLVKIKNIIFGITGPGVIMAENFISFNLR